jgi:acyl carrier protein
MKSKLLKTLSDTLGISETDLNESSSAENFMQWDSLMHMNIIFAVEDTFNITIPDSKLSESTSVKSLLSIIEQEV